jgi:hypothetical protein
LTTKQYVDDLVYGYINSADIDAFKIYVNNALNQKAKSAEVYKKNETYSKAQIDTTINSLVLAAANDVLVQHVADYFHPGTEVQFRAYLETYLTVNDYIQTSDLNPS